MFKSHLFSTDNFPPVPAQRLILILSFSTLLCLSGVDVFAQARTSQGTQQSQPQERSQDTIVAKPRQKKPDSLKEKFYFRSLRVGTDVISIVKSSTTTVFSGWEVNGDADFGKLYVAVDIGQWSRNYSIHSGDYGAYSNNGSYWRAGIDLNLLKKDPDRNMFFFGFRFGQSYFKEQATLVFPTIIGYTITTKTLENSSVTANWGELVTGLRVKVWKQLWMGYTGRMKFASSANGDNQFKSFDIPGFGMNGNGFQYGFNYQIFWKFPFVKDKPAIKR